MVTTSNALADLEAGRNKGHDDFLQVKVLIRDGLMNVVMLGEQSMETYQSLVIGSAIATLDDGEAATISYALEVGGIPLIDERKARGLCARNYPELTVISTVELLLDRGVSEPLGPDRHIDAVMNALQKARMRVPSDQLSAVRGLIGDERAKRCNSLPAAARATR